MARRNVSGLTIYPVKSCRGIAVNRSIMDPRGLRFDRRWMIVDESGRFLTQREHPRLALVGVEMTGKDLTLDAPGTSPIKIPVVLEEDPFVQVQIWDDAVEAMTLDVETAEWISAFLGVTCRFVYLPDTSHRPVNPKYARHGEEVSFADAFPALLISEASLDDLNSRLQIPLLMNRFRPSIVVTGCKPYEEDTWKKIQIGPVVFNVAKPCSRCATTTVDQSTGIRGDEPLRTLATYRNKDGKVYFGENLIHENGGEISVGDEVRVLA